MLKKMAFGLVIGTAAASTSAHPNIQAHPEYSAYLQDSRGVVVRSQHGLCWRDSYWNSVDAVPGCDGELVPPIVKPTAPAIVPPPEVTQAPVAQAPMAQAPTAPIVPKPCNFTVTLRSDETFAFNTSVLSSAARKRIDEEVLSKLESCSKVDSVLVTGHTDRLGPEQYNQRLSEKRADMVAAYLKSKGTTSGVNALGAGESQPIEACDDKLPRAKLIGCLGPNRRVVIEVRGQAK